MNRVGRCHCPFFIADASAFISLYPFSMLVFLQKVILFLQCFIFYFCLFFWACLEQQTVSRVHCQMKFTILLTATALFLSAFNNLTAISSSPG